MNDERDNEQDTADRGSLWNALLAADDMPVDVELLAAFAEGRLSGRELESARTQIARSPLAMEIVDSLYDQANREVDSRRLDRDAAAAPDKQFVLAASAAALAGGQRRQRLALYAAAASVLVAAGTSYLAIEQWQTRGTMETQMAKLTHERDVLQAHSAGLSKERVSEYKRKLRRLSDSPGLLVGHVAGEDFDELLSLQKDRGPLAEDPVRQAEVEQVLHTGLSNLAAAFPEGSERLVEEGALFLSAGMPHEAETKADEGLAKYGRTAQMLNLKASALLAKAKEQKLAEAQVTLKAAEDLLHEIVKTTPAFAPAWFSLAVLHSEFVGDDAQAEDAWRQYVKCEADQARRTAVAATFLGEGVKTASPPP